MYSIMPFSNRLFASGPSLRYVLFTLAFLTFGLFVSCSAGKGESTNGTTGYVHITGNIGYCPEDSIRIYQLMGPVSEQIGAAKIVTTEGTSTFSIETTLPGPGLYAIGTNPRQSKSFLLGDNTELSLEGNCQNPAQSFSLKGSAINDRYQDLISTVTLHNQKIQQLQQNLQIFQQTDPGQVPRIQQEIQTENIRHFATLDSVLSRKDLVSKYASLYNFRPYGSSRDHQTKYENDLKYFQLGFFDGLDLNDPDIAKSPQLYEKAQFYASTLAAYVQPNEAKENMDSVLAKASPGSAGHQNLLKGFLTSLERRKSDLYITYADKFIADYQSDPITASISSNIARIKALLPGNIAPNISGSTPEGSNMALEDLRGKVVMIDFWASWCRPCRMENPNVVKAYNKYSPAGFEILGVSLDNDRKKWMDAIAADGLTWKHISDLGGWGSQPAAAYGVSSIPATFLLDQDGKIMAKNLRGPALENKLAEIFGY